MRDIFTGTVKEEDVLVIIARTDMNPHNDNHWNNIWEGYIYGGLSHPEWKDFADQYDDFRRMAIRLYDAGKIHQPRQFKAHPQRLPYYWLECFVPQNEMTPAQQKAFTYIITRPNQQSINELRKAKDIYKFVYQK